MVFKRAYELNVYKYQKKTEVQHITKAKYANELNSV